MRILLAVAALFALSACTPEEIAAVEAHYRASLEAETARTPTGPTLDYSVDCSGVTITTSGWPDGSYGVLGIGSEPPWAITTNTTRHWDLATSSRGAFQWSIYVVDGPGSVDDVIFERFESGWMDCGGQAH